MKTHHHIPPLLISNGTQVTEHTFMLTENAHPPLLLSSRIGFGGELVHRGYAITPPLPEKIARNPHEFLQNLIDLLKFVNYTKDENLWIARATYYGGPEAVHVDAHLTSMERYLFEFANPKIMHLDISPPPPQIHIEI